MRRLGKRRCFRTKEGIVIVYYPAVYHQGQAFWRRVRSLVVFSLWSLYILWRLRKVVYFLIAAVPPPSLPFLAAFYKRFFRHPFAVELYDAWPLVPEAVGVVPAFLRGALRKLSYWSYNQADVILALSPGISQALCLPRAYLSYNGTRPELFYRRKPPAFLPFRIIYAGTLGWVNYLDFLIEVANRLREYSAIEFWVIGEGGEKAKVVEKAAHLPALHFFPAVPVEEVPYWLSEAHIGVSTVRPVDVLSTNSANKFYDYLANGLVVGINYGGWQAELLRREKCGFSSSDVDSFCRKILHYYWHRREWEYASARARLVAERLFDRRILARQIIELLSPFSCT
ncbi:MAG: glycosyltransferase family 4 protein [Bacteroidia bacterium]|nr:glycosyltransferase family 4 protein [Bacteroidia bacterium]